MDNAPAENNYLHSRRNKLLERLRAEGVRINENFNNLEYLNGIEIALRLPPSNSKTKAIEAIRSKNVNIWDIVDGNFDRVHPTRAALRRYTRKHRLFFPLERARFEGLRAFLIHM
jgi:hypothetical protein